jgi:hypothetical protein
MPINPYNSKHPTAIALQNVIEELYDVFFEYHNHPLSKGSPISVTEEMRQPLETKKLRDLTVRDLDRFVFKLLNTWGGEDDLRHFLPRILELNAMEGLYWTSAGEDIFFKLARCWRTWKQKEQDAIEVYCQALWRYILDNVSVPEDYEVSWANKFLEAMNQIVDIQQYLDQWGNTTNEIRHLANLIRMETIIYREEGIVYHVAWSPYTDCPPTIRKWILQETHLSRLEKAFFQNPDSELFSDAADALNWLLKHSDE